MQVLHAASACGHDLSICRAARFAQKFILTEMMHPIGLGSLVRRDVILVSILLFSTVTQHSGWYLPGDILAAPASALCGWKAVALSNHSRLD